MIKIAPSILSADFAKMGEEVRRIETGGADIVHCDVMDGRFVPNLTFGMPMVKAIKKYTKLPLDVHLMIEEPERYIDEFCAAGADYITFHHTATNKTAEILQKIKKHGVKAGIAVNPDVRLCEIERYLEACDMLLIMSVYAGFGGQKFIPDSLDKLRRAAELKVKYNNRLLLEIDGGVTLENIREIERAGADIAVAGSCVFGADDMAGRIAKLHGES